MRIEVTIYDASDDKEFDALIDITSFGSGPTGPSWNYAGDPGEPPEWDIEKIWDWEGDIVPFRLRPTLRQRFEAWFNSRPLLGSINPEYMRLSELVTKHMDEDFDWTELEYDDLFLD